MYDKIKAEFESIKSERLINKIQAYTIEITDTFANIINDMSTLNEEEATGRSNFIKVSQKKRRIVGLSEDKSNAELSPRSSSKVKIDLTQIYLSLLNYLQKIRKNKINVLEECKF